MRIYSEMNLTSFEFWAGAKSNANKLTYDELNELENVLNDIYEEIEDTMVNDIMWFDFEWVCEILGLCYDANTDEVLRDE